MIAALSLVLSLAVEESPPLASESAVPLVSFTTPATTRTWSVMNDPVMGGRSKSAFSTEADHGHFAGTCAIVPFLKAPGFCKIATTYGWFQPKPKFQDVSRFIDGSLYLEVKSSSPAYSGFKVAFSAKNVTRPRPGMHHAGPSFKADFAVPAGSAWTTVKIPFSKFSVDWSEFTGECDTKDPTGEQHLCCSGEHPEVCPKDYHLKALTGFEVWAEGVQGDFAIDLKSISAGP